MSGQLDNLKSRKQKCCSRKVSAAGKRNLKVQKTHVTAEGSSVEESSESTDAEEKLTSISCEHLRSSDRKRCSASPELDETKGKENKELMEQEPGSCGTKEVVDKQERDSVMCKEGDKTLFPDDDSNQILPVEQFFGNFDIVQDPPQRSPTTSSGVPRKSRRRHFFALEDTDEGEMSLSSM